MHILSGGSSSDDNTQRKLQFTDGTWKLYDDRPGEGANFVYFPLSGYYANGANGHVDEYGYYWSSLGNIGSSAQILSFSSVNGVSHISNYTVTSNDVGFPVRCIQDI